MSQENKPKIFFATGGTGGHLLSAQKIANKLKNHAHITFIGKGLKGNPFFKKNAFSYYSINSSTLKKSIKGLFAPFTILVGCIESLYYLLVKKPDVIVGFGSYHSFPVLFAAKLLRKKILLFEANCVIGRVNKVIASKNIPLACQFPLINYPKNVRVIPVDPYPFHLDQKVQTKTSSQKTLLVFGGSLGAGFINDLLLQTVKNTLFPYSLLHITGNKKNVEFYQQEYKKYNVKAKVFSFVDDMDSLYQQADLVICRGGARTVAELLAYQKLAIIIPYPFAKDDHQMANAKFFTKLGIGLVYRQKDLSPKELTKGIIDLLDHKKRLKELFQFAQKDAQKIDGLIKKLCKSKTII